MGRTVMKASTKVSLRQPGGERVDRFLWDRLTGDRVVEAVPWRTFRWRNGQKHYSGTYWSATESGHVIYESRLELSCLLLADFDPMVKRIAAQPFLITTIVAGKQRRHIPDYLLLTNGGPIVVDVKPRERLAKPSVKSTFAWTRELVEGLGWRYQVSSEPDPVILENVRFLAGYRREWLFPTTLLNTLRNGVVDGITLAEACSVVADWPAPLVRSAILHLLWTQHFMVDPGQPLSSRLVLTRAAV
ncbi:TnsA-like heteromeric transposase endonuclease subunit [Nocardia sp. CA-120079]|uniref:TnsA-like heteromeric transposase endonuclease subunit n=1 Tax=Nocardia sp. CA-120079 TaxID=3239974 RepID=UPI003D9630AF